MRVLELFLQLMEVQRAQQFELPKREQCNARKAILTDEENRPKVVDMLHDFAAAITRSTIASVICQ